MSKIEAVEKFAKRVDQASRTGSREVRLSMQEATEVVHGMAVVLARVAALEDRLRALEAPQTGQNRIDGGGLGE